MPFEFADFYFVLTHLELDKYASVVPSKTIPDSRPKWAKCIPARFQTKRPKNPTDRGGTYLYSLYKGVPGGVGEGRDQLFCSSWSKMICNI